MAGSLPLLRERNEDELAMSIVAVGALERRASEHEVNDAPRKADIGRIGVLERRTSSTLSREAVCCKLAVSLG